MTHKLLVFVLLSSSSLSAYTTFFAPYDGPLPVSIESRLDGIIWRRPNWPGEIEDRLNWNFKGYVKFGRGIFLKTGASVFASRVTYYDRFHERVGVDVQLGKYWHAIGAVRVGLFYDGPGIGADYWVIYKERFKWLTTLELAANKVHGGYHYDSFKPFVKWLNRFFVYGGIYISFGINHLGDTKSFKNSRTQGFLGFGATI